MILCKKCGEAFHGRSNRQYCSTACKSAVNNKRQLVKTKELIETNKILRRNRRIMSNLYNLFESQPIERAILDRAGLDANFNTGTTNDSLIFYEYILSRTKSRTDLFFITKN